MNNSRSHSRRGSLQFDNGKFCFLIIVKLDKSQQKQNLYQVQPTPRLEHLHQRRESFIKKRLPQIKALRLNKAVNWKRKKNSLAKASEDGMDNYRSHNELNAQINMF